MEFLTGVKQPETLEIKELLDQANTGAKKYLVSETISENPVVAVWRQAYQKFPTKKGARCSIEALLKRVLHGNPVGTIAPTVDITNSITITISTLSNVGPTLGTEIGPTMSWNDLPVFAKWICSILMLMGRLEIFSVLIIFTPLFWKDR